MTDPEREAAERRADKLQASLDRMADLLAKQGEELAAIRKMLRRREDRTSSPRPPPAVPTRGP